MTKREKLVSDAARAMQAQRRTFAGGRPPVIRACKKCGQRFSATELRAHRCPEKAQQ